MDKLAGIQKKETDKNVSDFPRHERNPFMNQFMYMRNTRNKVVAAGQIYGAHDKSTGEVNEELNIRAMVVERVDKEAFIRVFDDYLQVIFGLSKRALMVLKYTMTALKFNDDSIYFDLKEAKKTTGYNSKDTIFKGLAELMDKQVLARGEKVNFYFINPRAFVRGNRLDMLKVWVTKDSKEDKELTEQIKAAEAAHRQIELFPEEPQQQPEAAE